VEIGAADEICFRPRRAYTQALLAAVTEADPRRQNLLHAA
jgi:ABC-type oligopeptide transport system ATPase subunit